MGNSELLIFEAYAYIKHRLLSDNLFSCRCAQSNCKEQVCVCRKDAVEIAKITANSPLGLISKNVNSGKRLHTEQQFRM